MTTLRVITSRTNSTKNPIRKSKHNKEKYGAPVSRDRERDQNLSIETGMRLSRPRVLVQAVSKSNEKGSIVVG